MRKVIAGAITGLVLGILWSMNFTAVREGSETTTSSYLSILISPVTLIMALVGVIIGFLSLKVTRIPFIFLGAIIISIVACLIISSWSGMYTVGTVIGLINGLLIAAAVVLIGRYKQPT